MGLDGTWDLIDKYAYISLDVKEKFYNYYDGLFDINVEYDDSALDKWTVNASGSILKKEFKINSRLKKDMSSGSMSFIYDGKRIGQMNARDFRLSESGLSQVTVFYNFHILGILAVDKLVMKKKKLIR